MNKHCKSCKFHHNAGHKEKNLKKYNDWCTKYSEHAAKVVGECKLKKGKENE